MGAAILSLIGPVLGPLLAIIAALAALAMAYFGIKRKGVTEERDRQEKKHAEAVARVQEKVQTAVAKDTEIDKKVANEIKITVEKIDGSTISSNPNRFRF